MRVELAKVKTSFSQIDFLAFHKLEGNFSVTLRDLDDNDFAFFVLFNVIKSTLDSADVAFVESQSMLSENRLGVNPD